MTVSTNAGVKLYIAPPGPLTPEPAWKEIGEIINYGEFGRVYALITHQTVNNRGDRKFKGTYNDGAMPLQLGRDASDEGQALMRTALDDDHAYLFKCELNDTPVGSGSLPTVFTFEAMVMSYTCNPGGVNQVVGATATVEINSGTIDETPASGPTP